MAQRPNLPVLSPDGNLSRYLDQIRKFPMLTADEEYMLAKSWQEHGDLEAAHRLVTSHLRLVAKIATGYRGYGLPLAELISEGNVGMMQAGQTLRSGTWFPPRNLCHVVDPRGNPEYILHSWSLVKIGTTAAQKKLFFNLRKLKGQMQAIEEGDLSPEQVTAIAEKLDVPEAEVVSMNRRMAAPTIRSTRPCAVTARANGRIGWSTNKTTKKRGLANPKSWPCVATS